MKATVRSRNSAYRYVDSVCNALGEQFKPHQIEMTPVKSVRSMEQNAYLWGVCYATILEQGGLTEQGWRAEDLHEYFLGEHFGWQSLAAFGRKRLRPVHRSSTLKKAEFSDFIAYIQQKAAEMGVYIPDPEER